MEKLYNQIVFENDKEPALDAANLNRMSKAINDIDDRVIEGFANAIIAGLSAEQAKQSAAEAKASEEACTSLKTLCEEYVASASEASASAQTSAELAQTTVADLSAQFQDAIDKIDAIVGGE